MKTQTQNSGTKNAYKHTSKLLLTGCMVIGLTAGWLLGNLTTRAFSQSGNNNIENDGKTLLLSTSFNGEILPTILLKEFAVIADQTL